MEEMVGYQATLPPGTEEDLVKPSAQRLTAAPHAILVDQTGVRYQNEGGSYMAYCKGVLERTFGNTNPLHTNPKAGVVHHREHVAHAGVLLTDEEADRAAVRQIEAGEGIPRRAKIVAIGMLWISIGFGVYTTNGLWIGGTGDLWEDELHIDDVFPDAPDEARSGGHGQGVEPGDGPVDHDPRPGQHQYRPIVRRDRRALERARRGPAHRTRQGDRNLLGPVDQVRNRRLPRLHLVQVDPPQRHAPLRFQRIDAARNRGHRQLQAARRGRQIARVHHSHKALQGIDHEVFPFCIFRKEAFRQVELYYTFWKCGKW